MPFCNVVNCCYHCIRSCLGCCRTEGCSVVVVATYDHLTSVFGGTIEFDDVYSGTTAGLAFICTHASQPAAHLHLTELARTHGVKFVYVVDPMCLCPLAQALLITQ